MNKRNLILGLIALLIVIAGTWGVLKICVRTPVRSASGNTTAHISSTDQISLYKTGRLSSLRSKSRPPRVIVTRNISPVSTQI